jgi:hypothetical protein
MRTQPHRSLRGPETGKNRLTPEPHGAAWAVAFTLLASFLIGVASGSAQPHQQTARLRLDVYVIPAVTAAPNADRNLPSPGNSNSVISLATFRWESIEGPGPPITSPWAGIISELQGEPPTLAPSLSFDDPASSDPFPPTRSKPFRTAPPNGEIVLHTFTYVTK